MGLFTDLFKKNKCTDKNNKYYGYSNDLKEYCEYRDKYLHVWNLSSEYTEKINHYYYNYINTSSSKDFNSLLLYCQKYIELLPQLEEAKKEDSRINNATYDKPYCVAYHKLAMAYEKGECYNSAINVCNDAIAQGYSDGTKGGFESRLKRLRKKQAEINTKK